MRSTGRARWSSVLVALVLAAGCGALTACGGSAASDALTECGVLQGSDVGQFSGWHYAARGVKCAEAKSAFPTFDGWDCAASAIVCARNLAPTQSYESAKSLFVAWNSETPPVPLGSKATSETQSGSEAETQSMGTLSADDLTPEIIKGWAQKWCQAQPGISRDELYRIMGPPTSEYLGLDNPNSSWDAAEWAFYAFFDVDGNVRTLDVNDINLSDEERASIPCELIRET